MANMLVCDIVVCIKQLLRNSRLRHKVNFLQILTDLNSELSFPRLVATTRLKSRVCPTILLMDEGNIVRFISFPKVKALCENPNRIARDLNSGRRVHFLHYTMSASYEINLPTKVDMLLSRETKQNHKFFSSSIVNPFLKYTHHADCTKQISESN